MSEQAVTPSVLPRETVREDTTRRNLGTCPACRGYLWAEVTTQTFTREPHWTEARREPSAQAVVVVAACHLEHDCDRREDES